MLFPLDVCAADTPEQRVVRTLVGVDEGAQSVTFTGDLPEGGYARLTRSSTERLVDSAARAADVALQGMPGAVAGGVGQLWRAASCWVSTPTTRSRPWPAAAGRLPCMWASIPMAKSPRVARPAVAPCTTRP